MTAEQVRRLPDGWALVADDCGQHRRGVPAGVVSEGAPTYEGRFGYRHIEGPWYRFTQQF